MKTSLAEARTASYDSQVDVARATISAALQRIREAGTPYHRLDWVTLGEKGGPVRAVAVANPHNHNPHGVVSVFTSTPRFVGTHLAREEQLPGIITDIRFEGDPFETPLFEIEQNYNVKPESKGTVRSRTSRIGLIKTGEYDRLKGHRHQPTFTSSHDFKGISFFVDSTYFDTIDGQFSQLYITASDRNDEKNSRVGFEYVPDHPGGGLGVALGEIKLQGFGKKDARKVWIEPLSEHVVDGEIRLKFKAFGNTINFNHPARIDTLEEIEKMIGYMENGTKYKP